MQTDTHTDLITVGAGILDLATAFRACQQRLPVRVINRAERPVGSSIMNFGRACFTDQADAVQDVTMNAYSSWAEAVQKTGLWAAASDTYIPAVTGTEMQFLEEFANHRGSDQVRLMNHSEVANAIGSPDLKYFSGAHPPLNMRVNPHEATPRLAAWLENQGVIFDWRREAKTAAGGRIDTNRKCYQAERIVCCPNFWLTSLFPELADEHEVHVCALQMALIERPTRIPKDITLFTGTSLTRYDSFAGLLSATALRQELRDNSPELVNCVANVMPTGIKEDLFISDSHTYDLSPNPFLREKTSNLLLDTAYKYFGIKESRIIQHQQGRYSDSTRTNLILEQPDSQATVAVITSGIEMTLSFGIADLALQGTEPTKPTGF